MPEDAVTTEREAPAPGEDLVRVLGARDAAAIMISNMIGVGILTLPGMVAVSVGHRGIALIAWALAGLVSLAGALVQAELGCRYPMAGGDYVFLRAAFGPLAAFLSGWTSFVVGFPGAIAASSMAAANSLLDAADLAKSPWALCALALAFLVGISWIHSTGLHAGKRFQNALVCLKLAVLLVVVGAGLLLVPPASTTGGAPRGAHFATAAFFLLFAYSGWNSAAYVAGEVRDPRRNLPRALIGGVLIVTVLYVAVNVTYFRVVPFADMGKNINILGEVAGRVFGSGGGRIVSFALTFVFLGSASAMIITGPRIYYAMARDGLFPEGLTRISPTARVPARSLWLQTAWAAAILCAGTILTEPDAPIGDTFEKIVGWTIFSILPFAALTTAAVFVLRSRDDSFGRTANFPASGYPWTAIVSVAVTLAVEVGFIIVGVNRDLSGSYTDQNRLNILVGCLLVGSGVPVYLFWKLRARARAAGSCG